MIIGRLPVDASNFCHSLGMLLPIAVKSDHVAVASKAGCESRKVLGQSLPIVVATVKVQAITTESAKTFDGVDENQMRSSSLHCHFDMAVSAPQRPHDRIDHDIGIHCDTMRNPTDP